MGRAQRSAAGRDGGGAGAGRSGAPKGRPSISSPRAPKPNILDDSSTARTPVETKTWTYHGRVRIGRRTAGRRGWAGTGRTGRRRVGSPRRQPSPLPSRRSKKTLLGVSLEARTKETLCKPKEEQNPRLTRSSSAVYPRNDGRSLFLVVDQGTDASLSL